MSFSALLVVGDKKGRVGVALGKAPDTVSAIRKGARRARKRLVRVPMKGTTIPFALIAKRGAAKVLLKPAPPGTGVIAGGAVRAVVEAAGIRDIVAKILGSANKASNVYATLEVLKRMKRIADREILRSEPEPPAALGEARPRPKSEKTKTASGKGKPSRRVLGDRGKRTTKKVRKEPQ